MRVQRSTRIRALTQELIVTGRHLPRSLSGQQSRSSQDQLFRKSICAVQQLEALSEEKCGRHSGQGTSHCISHLVQCYVRASGRTDDYTTLLLQVGDSLEEFLLASTDDGKLRQLMMSMSEAIRTIAFKVHPALPCPVNTAQGYQWCQVRHVPCVCSPPPPPAPPLSNT